MSWYRSAVWFLKGLREYTRSGYECASKHFVPEDLEVNVTGRSFMITGANSGIGKATATEIAKKGGTLHLVCRNKERAEEAKREIITETGNENIFLHILDMSNPKGIWEFAEKFKTEHKLNVLINNAGCMVNKRELTEDGLEKNFATNTLGTYILTTALLPLLEKEDDPRVIIVSSGGMLVQKLDVSDLQSTNVTFDGTMVYAQNKRQQVVLTEQWAKVHKNIHFSVMHPGWADTPAVRSAMPEFYERMKNKLRTEAQGADTVVWLAISSAATKQTSGLFFQETVSRLQREISELQFICKFDALSSGLNKDCEWLAKYRSSFPSLGIHTSRSTAGNRQPVSTHLPLARTYSSPAEEEKLMEALEQLSQQFKPARSLL